MSRSKWEEMAAYSGELVAAVKDARGEAAKREASEKAKQYIKDADARSKAPKESPKADAPAKKKGNDISIGGTLDKVKARNKVLSDL
jgi:hypothetical protein